MSTITSIDTEAARNTEIVRLEGIAKSFGNVPVLKRVSLSITAGEFFSILGPSGCGKTTLLRIIAGLEQADSGEVLLDGKSMTGVPPQRRPVNTVFQAYALFPHLTVRDNVSFGLRMRKTPRDEIKKRATAIMETMRVAELQNRLPSQLSGGQKQRVALARAAINEPSVLLLDEPLAAIDAKLRKELQLELKEFQKRFGITFIYVTHDQEEALGMSNRVALVNEGRIEQIGFPRDIYERPRTRFAASFLGACNIIEGTISQPWDSLGSVIDSKIGSLRAANIPFVPGRKVAIGIRPERIQLLHPSDHGENSLDATINSISYRGSQTELHVISRQCALRLLVLNHEDQAFSTGASLRLGLPPDALVLLEES